jgi:Uma2 family endonuclease
LVASWPVASLGDDQGHLKFQPLDKLHVQTRRASPGDPPTPSLAGTPQAPLRSGGQAVRAQAVLHFCSMAQRAAVDPLLGPRLTLDEWSDLPEDVPGELVDGRLVEEEVPDYLHEVLVAWLARVLGNWSDVSGAIVGGSEAKFALSPTRGRKADLTVYLGGRRPPSRGTVSVPPDIAVEVVSPSPRDQRRDREEKMNEYAAFGIRFYWLVDPQQRSLEIYERVASGVYESRLQGSRGVLEAIPGCPDLVLDLDVMWAKIDSLDDRA